MLLLLALNTDPLELITTPAFYLYSGVPPRPLTLVEVAMFNTTWLSRKNLNTTYPSFSSRNFPRSAKWRAQQLLLVVCRLAEPPTFLVKPIKSEVRGHAITS